MLGAIDPVVSMRNSKSVEQTDLNSSSVIICGLASTPAWACGWGSISWGAGFAILGLINEVMTLGNMLILVVDI